MSSKSSQSSNILPSTCNAAEFVLNRPLHNGAPLGFMNGYIYQVCVVMANTPHAVMCLFIHNQLFSGEQIDAMVKESIEIIVKTRIHDVRKHAKISADCDIAAMNKDYFPGYMGVFEAIMADKFDFRILKPLSTTALIPETIKPKGK